MPKKSKHRYKDKELLEVGKKLKDFYDTGYANKKQFLIYTFVKGLVYGFGAFLGGTILIAILLWSLSLFKEIPLLSHFVEVVKRSFNVE